MIILDLVRKAIFLSSLFFFFLISLFFVSAKTTLATVLFEDNFDNGSSSNWARFSGPNLWQVNNGKFGARINYGSTIIETSAGNILTPNYIIEFDMIAISGEDKNLEFRMRNNQWNYRIHFNNSSGGMAELSKIGITQAGWPKVKSFTFENNRNYHIKIILDDKNIKFYIDEIKLFNEYDADYQYTVSEKIALIASTGSTYPTEIWFDNVVVRTIDPLSLNVPVLKQTSDPWGTQTYDKANIWNPLNQTIGDWGCALTSATMVLNYHGINKLPNGTSLDPGTLNTWLKTQTDGYIGNGLINWLAISRLSKLAKSINNITNFDALEYFRVNGDHKDILTADLNSNEPDILEEPGHFIVAKGIQGDSFLINDPYYGKLSLNDYSNTFLSIGTYIPSNTDLSYMMLVTDPNIQLSLIDSSDIQVGDQFIQAPIINPKNGAENGTSQRIFYLRKPTNGDYDLLVSSGTLSDYNIKIYFYDTDGNPLISTQTGIASPDNQNTIKINFDKDKSKNSKAERVITIDTVLNDIKFAQSLNLITNRSIATELIGILKKSREDIQKGRSKICSKKLDLFESIIKIFRGKYIEETAFQILLNDVNYLKNNL
ncbi:hypothetical protein C4559_00080 [Candidatus Microgenomates bacterium]|nr:MAG: hypothetical protein C4559_00080 [Candidatus Microgenomates bacterium]